jgi:hypothetical protein
LPTVSGGDFEEATPDPIPNSEVKLFGADGTAREAVWESRTPPGFFPKHARDARTPQEVLLLVGVSLLSAVLAGPGRALYASLMATRAPSREPEPLNLGPAMGFKLTMAERARAAMGPPAYLLRRRAIEDLELLILERLRQVRARHASGLLELGGTSFEELAARFVGRDLARLNELIDRHNRYYCIEANLPLDPRTGLYVDGGKPFERMRPFRFEDLLARSAGDLVPTPSST